MKTFGSLFSGARFVCHGLQMDRKEITFEHLEGWTRKKRVKR